MLVWGHCDPVGSDRGVGTCTRTRAYINTGSRKLKNITLLWRPIGRNGVSNHQPCDCLPNRLFRRRLNKHQSSASWSLWGEFTGDRWIPRTKVSNAENVSIWWRHYEYFWCWAWNILREMGQWLLMLWLRVWNLHERRVNPVFQEERFPLPA